jgi:lipoprotein-anchoring transpeptidase ErfK/SrfK
MQQKSIHPASVAQPHRQASAKRPRRKSWTATQMLLVIFALGAVLMFATVGAVVLGVTMIYAQGILPGVQVAGIELGGLSQNEATARLSAQWSTITLRDGDRTWAVDPTTLGLILDVEATAQQAYMQGRGEGSLGSALFGNAIVQPVMNIDFQAAQQGLVGLESVVNLAPVNAGVQFVNGQVQTTPPQEGRALDVAATISQLQNGQTFDSRGTLALVMVTVQPTVTDASPMLAEAQRLLSNLYTFNVFDPVTGDVVQWSLPPETWAGWLNATPDSSRASGLAFTMNAGQAAAYLQSEANAILDSTRYVNASEAATDAQNAIANGSTQSYVRVYHHDRQHTVQPGETIITIAWDYGVPYLYVQGANGGISSVEPGQVITIPSPDNFFDFPPVPNKRIVVSISEQHMWVYENGALLWESVISTGISSSPTWPGIYQIISHEPNAYAGNWDLYMPEFMGVYRPIPGSDFTNGFHGFPMRGGSQLLWTNNLGTRVTYGCILVGDGDIQTLYNWAEEGVVVEIQP